MTLAYGRRGWVGANSPNVPITLNQQSWQFKGLEAAYPFFTPPAQSVRNMVRGNVLTPAGTPAVAVNRFGRGVTFNGATDYYFTPLVPPTGADPRTIALWLSVNDTTPASNTNFIGYGVGGNGLNFALFILTTGEIRLGVQGGYVQHNTAFPDTNAHLLVGVVPSGASDVTDCLLYLDGLPLTVDASVARALNTGAGTFHIGSNHQGTFTTDGTIYDVKHWSYALNPAAIWSLYDPAIRWDAYMPVSRMLAVKAPVAAIGNPWYHRLQQRVTN